MLVKPGIAKAALIACLAALIMPAQAEDAAWDAVVECRQEGRQGRRLQYDARRSIL